VSKVIESIRTRRDEVAKDIPKLQEEVLRAEHALTRAQELLTEAQEMVRGLDEASGVLDDIKNGNAVITRVESKTPVGAPK
jgi:hypothetical protein